MHAIYKFGLAVFLVGSMGNSFGQSKVKHNADRAIKVTVDNKAVIFDGTQPMAIKGVTMVPLRGIFEKIGAFVEYDAANHTVSAHRANEVVELRMGDKIAKKNGAEIMMEVPANIVGGSTMVPLRFIAEALGAKVGFDPATNTVSILTSETGFGPGGGKAGSTGGGR